MSKSLRVSTVKALAACHTVGLTYHAHLEGETVFWAVDGEFYHVVKRKTTAGVTRSAHYCRTYRSALAEKLSTTAQKVAKAGLVSPQLVPEFSREAVALELVLVSPSWLCDADSEFIEITDPAAAVAQVWIEGQPC
jgi:hypothetical protein